MNARQAYPHFQTITTRWKDNDIYGHVNNVEYYSYFDTVINTYLIRQGGLDIHDGEAIGVCAESHCRFLDSLGFPDAVDAGLRVAKLGNSSVRYEIGLFREGSDQPAAEGGADRGADGERRGGQVPGEQRLSVLAPDSAHARALESHRGVGLGSQRKAARDTRRRGPQCLPREAAASGPRRIS